MFQTENQRLPQAQERWNDTGPQRPYNLFFALLPEPEIVSQVADLGTTVCRAHRFRGKPIWPDRLHMTLLSAADPNCGLIENATRAMRAAARVDAPVFNVALDITESFYLRRETHPFVLASGSGVAAAAALRRSIAEAMVEEGFGVRISRDFTLHMTLMWADRRVDEYPILPIHWTVREFALVLSHVGKSRHEHLAKWTLRG
jgi:2'-5' RNA ligase